MGDQAILVLKKELESVIQSISETSRSLKQAKEKRRSLEHALEILVEAPPLAGRTRNGGASLEDFATRILQEEGALLLDEIVSHLVKSGREAGKPSVTTALSRLKRNKVIRKRDDGRWCLTEEENDDDELENDEGDPKSDMS